MYELFKDGPCNSLTFEKSIIFVITLLIHVAIVFLVAVFIVFKTLKTISSIKNSLSSSTYRMYQQFIISLAVQLTIPFLFIILPAAFLIFAVLLNAQNIKDYAANALQGLFLHSAVNSLSVLIVIKIYREETKRILLKPFYCYKPEINVKVFQQVQ
uniref:Uncharacterized protein n=1 Tax=Panagrolaimus davidi TaxID=227884 RepID=A0A914QFI4_9BILA